jgi:hypothetical protein
LLVGTLATLPLVGGALISRVRAARVIAVRFTGRLGVERGRSCGNATELPPRHAAASLFRARGSRGGSGQRSVLTLDVTIFGGRIGRAVAVRRRNSIGSRRGRRIDQRSLSDRLFPLGLGERTTTRQIGAIPLPYQHSDR